MDFALWVLLSTINFLLLMIFLKLCEISKNLKK